MNAPRARLGLLPFLVVAVMVSVPTSPVSAQYMYLDSNGDGAHSSADQLNGNGLPTTVDVYLITDRNRDGSPAICFPETNETLRVLSYAVCLLAVGGTVAYSDFTNGIPGFGVHFGEFNPDGIRYKNGFGGSLATLIGPGGPFRLCTVRITGVSGTPRIDIVDLVSGAADWTSFGGPCDGHDLDNTYKLIGPAGGLDWTDVDGLAPGTGGGPNLPPVLGTPSDMSAIVGETSSQTISATDPDRLPLDIFKVSGPDYVHVELEDPGNGTATGSIHVAPFVSDVGAGTVTVRASDGDATDEATLNVSVSPGANHSPFLSDVREMIVVADGVSVQMVSGSDPDGNDVVVSLESGPPFLELTTLSVSPGETMAQLRAIPSRCEVGTFEAALTASDGVAADRAEFTIQVAEPAPGVPVQVSGPPIPRLVLGMASGDLNGDGHLDLATVHEFSNVVTVLMGGPSFGLTPTQYPTTHRHSSITMGDWNGDGNLDMAVTNNQSASFQALFGNGDGTFSEGPTYPVMADPVAVIAADFNRDGALDLVLGSRFHPTVFTFLGAGDGSFQKFAETRVSDGTYGFATGDWNLDGRLDLATAGSFANSVSILLGMGDGSFAERRDMPVEGDPFSLVAGDWNGDGAPDLAVGSITPGKTQVFLGDGTGMFTAGSQVGGDIISNQMITAGDINGDGNDDLCMAGPFITNRTFVWFGNGDGTFVTIESYPTGIAPAMVLTGDIDRNGHTDLYVADREGSLLVVRNPRGAPVSVQANAFSSQEGKAVNLSAGGGTICFRVEPEGASYQNTEVDLASFTLHSRGTGSVEEIPSIRSKNNVQGDKDRDGVAEVEACFARTDVARLYSNLTGSQTAHGWIEGSLQDGRRFCAPVHFEIAGTSGGHLAVSVYPNPLNPRATLRFSTSRDGFAKVRMYDLHGRLVRTLYERPLLPAGNHEVEIDGRSQNGQTLASGIYFYEVEASEGRVRGRLTILK